MAINNKLKTKLNYKRRLAQPLGIANYYNGTVVGSTQQAKKHDREGMDTITLAVCLFYALIITKLGEAHLDLDAPNSGEPFVAFRGP